MHQFYTPDIISDECTLNEEESKHCIKVLRLKEGQKIQLMDGKGSIYLAEIKDGHYKKCTVKIIETKKNSTPNYTITIAIAPTKSIDRLEWFIEKSTEIGIHNIIPFISSNSERAIIKTERLHKMAISAMKQSMNPFLPKIEELKDFNKIIEESKDFDGEKFIAHCHSNSLSHIKNVYTKNKSAYILIGPEGDFSNEEIDFALTNGYKAISLGQNRLRTETAAIYACTCINILNES